MHDNDELLPVSDFRSLVKYDVTPEQIEAKKAAYAALEATTPKGYEEVRKARADVRGFRFAVEERRKELKKVPLEMGRYIDDQAKELTSLILSIEEPLSLKLKAVDDEKERIRKEKEAAEKAAIEAEVRAKREAEEARLKAIRDEEERRLAEERKALEAEKARLAEEKRKADEAARVERERIEAEQKAERDRLAAERAKVEAEQKAERERLAAEQRKVEEERRRVQAEKEAADRAEFERQARIKAEAEAKAKAERDAREAEERRVAEEARKAAEAKRREEMRPDVEKVAAFADLIAAFVPPNVTSDECVNAVNEAMKRLAYTARGLRDFAEKARAS